jgi:hypothetical protein
MKQVALAVAGPVSVLLAHYAAVISHEYAHSFMAFALGYKSNPLIIHWGGRSLANLLLLININEQVDYAAMFARGDGLAAALVGFAGPGLANGTLYLLSLCLLRLPVVRGNASLFTQVFWFSFMNIGNFYDYVPIRTFASRGDIAHITQGLGISPWVAHRPRHPDSRCPVVPVRAHAAPGPRPDGTEFPFPARNHCHRERRHHVRLFRPCWPCRV